MPPLSQEEREQVTCPLLSGPAGVDYFPPSTYRPFWTFYTAKPMPFASPFSSKLIFPSGVPNLFARSALITEIISVAHAFSRAYSIQHYLQSASR
mgnify:CR=1 FL=1